MLEKNIEKKVCDYAKKKKILCYKFTSPSNRGVPDRIFLKNGKVFFVEFKAQGKKPTKLQQFIIDEFKNEKVDVFVIDNVEEGVKLIDFYGKI